MKTTHIVLPNTNKVFKVYIEHVLDTVYEDSRIVILRFHNVYWKYILLLEEDFEWRKQLAQKYMNK